MKVIRKRTASRLASRLRRHIRVRKKIRGTEARPRLVVHRSARHIYAQIVDDSAGRTLVSASSVEPEFAGKPTQDGGKMSASRLVGERIAERAREAGVKNATFDRNGYLYHGRVRALADAARENGLEL